MAHPTPVVLIDMPLSNILNPSLGLGLLKAGLIKKGIATVVLNLQLVYAKRVNQDHYVRFAGGDPMTVALLGEWIFADAMWAKDPALDARYWRTVFYKDLSDQYPGGVPQLRKDAEEMRAVVPGFMDDCVEAADWSQARVAGFTTMFQQQNAALAMARRLKEQYPHLLIVFGGPDCEDRMGVAMLRSYPWIDAVCNGEGDLAFPEFVEGYLATGELPAVAGMICRRDLPHTEELRLRNLPLPRAAHVTDLDALPTPDFDDFVAQWAESGLRMVSEVRLQFEATRGCWWGQKRPCTFCGLNGVDSTYRSKTAERVLAELEGLYLRYGHFTTRFFAADRIFDWRFWKTLLPAMRDRRWPIQIWCETKANLNYEQVKLLGEAGFTAFQPGIESLSTPVLRLMNKGVSALQNIQVLKWGRELGLMILWNLLGGFPGEDPADYERMRRRLPWLSHLCPPGHASSMRLDRFSRYFNAPAEMGVANVRPFPAYAMVYRGLPESELAELAYFFTFDYQDGRQVSEYLGPVIDAVKRWQVDWKDSQLRFQDDGERLTIWDLRPAAPQAVSFWEGLQRRAFLACDAVTRRSSLAAQLGVTEAELMQLIDPLIENGLMLEDEGALLSLAIPLDRTRDCQATSGMQAPFQVR